GTLVASEKIREILSAQTMFRLEIIPELFQIIEKTGNNEVKKYNLLFFIYGWEEQTRDFVEYFYERMKEHNKTPISIDGPSDHTWLKENNVCSLRMGRILHLRT
ncbi:hypothetical protein PFISCL1PPCAC_6850, partial [Pristionchus fissidentatus]